MKWSLRLLYLYLFSFVGLLITIISGIQIVDLTLKTYVFRISDYPMYPVAPMLDPKGEVIQTVEEQKEMNMREAENQRKRSLSTGAKKCDNAVCQNTRGHRRWRRHTG